MAYPLTTLYVLSLLNHEHLELLPGMAISLVRPLVPSHLISAVMLEATVAVLHTIILTHLDSNPTFAGAESTQFKCLPGNYSGFSLG